MTKINDIKNLISKYRDIPIQIRGLFWLFICAFLQRAMSSITTPIFTRLMSPAEYGKFSVFLSWLSVLTIIVSLNLSGGVYMQSMVKYPNEKKKIGSSFQGLTLTLVMLWFGVYLIFKNFWNKLLSLTTLQFVLMFIMIWTQSTRSLWLSEQREAFKYKTAITLTLLDSIIKPTLCIILVLGLVDKVTARILGMAIIEVVLCSWCFFYQLHEGKVFYSRKYWIYGLKFNIPLLPHYLSMFLLSSADRIMISYMIGDDKAGIYSLAYQISSIMIMFNNALFQIVEPWIYKKIKNKQFKDLSKVAYLSFVLIAVANLILIILAPEVVKIFAPLEYCEAILVIPPISMSVFFMYVYTYFATFEFYYEKKEYITVATMTGAILNLVLNYIFLPIFGYYVAGYTTLLCYMIYAFMHYFFMRKICKMYINDVRVYDARVLMAITLTFISLGCLFMILYKYTIIRFMIIVIVSIIIFYNKKKFIGVIRKFVSLKNSS